MKKITLLLFVLLCLTNCSSLPKGNSFIDKTKELKPQESLIKICRPKVAIMWALKPDIFINGNLIGDIVNGSIIEIPVVANNSLIKVEFLPYGHSKFGVQFKLNPQEEKIIFISADLTSIIPVPTFSGVLGVMKYRWQAVIVDKELFEEKCVDLETIRFRFLQK